MTSPRIFFLHNPKAGGSSLRSVFASLNGGGSIAPVFGNAPADHEANRRFASTHRGYDLYAGHYGYDVYQEIGRSHLLVTNFRDPIQRIHSIYRYWRNDVLTDSLDYDDERDHSVVMLAKNLSFSQFIRTKNEDLKLYISDFHFRQLYFSGWEAVQTGAIAEWVVRRRLRRMPWFYIAETPQISELLLRATIPGAAHVEIPVDNRTSGNSPSVSREDARHLVGLNLRDYAIYAYALKIQADRFKQVEARIRFCS